MAEARRDDVRVREFAETHGLTIAQAREIIERHGDDENALAEAARSLAHFLRAPS
jgi:hypothetical protein